MTSPEDMPSQEALDNCIRCGMCLPTCPTYALTGRERSSPRGRISLIRGVAEGNLPVESPVFKQEMSDCLGCLNCVTACPAGVRYGELLEGARAQVARQQPWWARALQRLVFAAFDRPALLSLGTRAMFLYQRSGLAALVSRSGVLRRLPGHLADFHVMMPSVAWRSGRSLIAPETPARGTRRGRVGMLLGCVMDVMFAPENVATVEVLQRQGFDVASPHDQPCCGALHAHSGRLDLARVQARRLIERFEREGVDSIVVNSAGCGNCMKGYGHLLGEDPEWAERARRFSAQVQDVQQFLDGQELDPPLPTSDAPLTYHDACHLAHGQGVRVAPRRLLKRLSPSGYRELADAETCCGSAGTYNLTHFETASLLLDKKVEAIAATGAEVVGVANPGCLLQIRYGLKRAGLPIRAEHPVVLLNDAWKKQESNNPAP